MARWLFTLFALGIWNSLKDPIKGHFTSELPLIQLYLNVLLAYVNFCPDCSPRLMRISLIKSLNSTETITKK